MIYYQKNRDYAVNRKQKYMLHNFMITNKMPSFNIGKKKQRD